MYDTPSAPKIVRSQEACYAGFHDHPSKPRHSLHNDGSAFGAMALRDVAGIE